MEIVRLIFTFYLTMYWKAVKTLTAPHLSRYISFIPDVGLMLSPPVSKQTPFPTKDTHLYESGLPLYFKFMKVGSFLLALPTACISLNPYFTRSSPFITVIYSPLLVAKSLANFSKNKGTPSSSPRPLQCSLFWFLACTRVNICYTSLVPFERYIFLVADFVDFLLYLWKARRSLATP